MTVMMKKNTSWEHLHRQSGTYLPTISFPGELTHDTSQDNAGRPRQDSILSRPFPHKGRPVILSWLFTSSINNRRLLRMILWGRLGL
jgi:hypothetical protein